MLLDIVLILGIGIIAICMLPLLMVVLAIAITFYVIQEITKRLYDGWQRTFG
jgi:divalent metal cation (Fe/Co/Zn/Cd) transporter